MSPRFTKLFEEEVNSVKVAYFLAECETDTGEGVYPRFGAAIETEAGERATFPDIFANRDAAASFVGELARGHVTPTTLRDIVSDRLYAMEE